MNVILMLLVAAAQARAADEKIEIDGTVHTIVLVDVPGADGLPPFKIAKHETTWGLFDFFFEGQDLEGVDTITRPTKAKSFLGQVGLPPEFLRAERPVTNLRWNSPVSFCEWLSRKTGDYYRLPTESEWEHAAKAGGEPAPGWTEQNSERATHPGGGLKANAWGIHDMLGNVWEYCLEQEGGAHFNPVLRGGAWNVPADQVKLAARTTVPRAWFDDDPNRPRSTWWLQSNFTQGFRVVRVAGKEDRADRKAYLPKLEVKVEGFEEDTHRIEGATAFFNHIKGTVKNTGDRPLIEVEVMVFSVTEEGKPHLIDIRGADKPGRATWSKVWPVLASSGTEGTRKPLGPGEERAWAVCIPYSFDDPPDVEPEVFGARVTNVRFGK